MPEPASLAPAPSAAPLGPHPAVEGAAPVPPEPSGTSGGVDDALSAIETMQQVPDASAGPDASEVASGLVAAYREDGRAGVVGYLDAHPGALAVVAHMPEEAFEAELDRAFPLRPPRLRSLVDRFIGRNGIAGTVYDYLESAVRSRILMEGDAIHRGLHRDLDALDAALPGRIDALRSATPESASGRLAAELGIRGDAGDLGRARASVERQRARVDAFLSYLASARLWETHELPAAAARAATSLGFGDAPPGSLGASLIHGTNGDAPPPLDGGARQAYFQLARQALILIGVGAEFTNPVLLATSLVLDRFDTLNQERHEGFVAYGRRLGL